MLQEAVARDPRNSFLKGDLIRVEGEINGVDAAVAKARASAAGEPENNIYDLVSAELYEKAGRIPDAIAVLEKAVAARPSDENLAIALARLYSRSGDFAKAESLLTARLRADPKNIAIGTALAQQYLATGRDTGCQEALCRPCCAAAERRQRPPRPCRSRDNRAELAGSDGLYQPRAHGRAE